MLVLSRKKNQSLIIGDDLEVVIMDIKSDQVKIGIKASKDIKIYRKEIYDKIKSEMREAAKSAIPRTDEEGK